MPKNKIVPLDIPLLKVDSFAEISPGSQVVRVSVSVTDDMHSITPATTYFLDFDRVRQIFIDFPSSMNDGFSELLRDNRCAIARQINQHLS